MRGTGIRAGRRGRRAWIGGMVMLILVAAQPHGASPASMYTYVDENGAVVLTDRLEAVPQRFRDQAQRVERNQRSGSPDSPDSSGLVSAPSLLHPGPASSPAPREAGGPWRSPAQWFWSVLPERIVPGMTQHQSVLLIGGFLLGSIVFGTMMLTKSPALKFAMKWALIFVAGGTVYGLYFSELGTNLSATAEPVTKPRNVLDRVRTKAKNIERIQQERLRGMERMGQIEDPEAEP